MKDDEKLVYEMLSHRDEMAKTVYRLYQPEIATVCHLLEKGEQVSESTVERLCDTLLNHCYDGEVVKLFKELCRAAVGQYPKLVEDYIRYYKEQWEK